MNLSDINAKPLLHYYESWWKVESECIYYLAGKASDDPELGIGWYYSDETEQMNGPYESRSEAVRALETHLEHL